MPIPNTLGRSYEYALCEKIVSLFSNISFTNRALEEQRKDISHYETLSESEKQAYDLSVSKICNDWLNTKILDDQSYSLDRLPDSAGVNGDVTDIRLESNLSTLNISLKHNHNALKHPRLTRVPTWIDIKADSNYRRLYDTCWTNFIQMAEKLNPNATLFRELVDIEENFIFDNLYNPLCNLVSNYLSNNISNIKQVQSLFKFMVGKYNFYKVIDTRDSVVIQDFIDMPMPTDVKIQQTDKSYIQMNFDNGVILTLRLHTASSRISTKSIKFDVRGSFDNMTSIAIPKN